MVGALAVSGTAAIAVAVTAQQPGIGPVSFGEQVALPAALPAGLGGRSGGQPGAADMPGGQVPSAHDSLPPVGPAMPASRPVAIDIPAIGVRSPLHSLGMTAKGTLRVPSGSRYDEAAWYNRSAAPGTRGPAVILGHVDSPKDGPSVFFKLGDLRPGDRVRVSRDDGTVAIFTVDGVRSYAKDEFPTRLVYGDTPHAALRLITCGGTFDRATGHYVDNVVVFASLHDAFAPALAATRGGIRGIT